MKNSFVALWMCLLLLVSGVCGAQPVAARLRLDGEVNDSSVAQLSLAINAINRLEKKPDVIQIVIDSGGGDFYAGWDLIRSIEKSEIKVQCAVDGMAASMAFVILESCDERVMTSRSMLMMHQVRIGGLFSVKELEAQLTHLKAMNEIMVNFVAIRMTVDKDYITEQIEQDWWMGPSEALRTGSVDEIVDSL